MWCDRIEQNRGQRVWNSCISVVGYPQGKTNLSHDELKSAGDLGLQWQEDEKSSQKAPTQKVTSPRNKSQEHRMNLSGSQRKSYSQHLQYLDAIKSSAKDLSLPIFETLIDRARLCRRVAALSSSGISPKLQTRQDCIRYRALQACLLSTKRT